MGRRPMNIPAQKPRVSSLCRREQTFACVSGARWGDDRKWVDASDEADARAWTPGRRLSCRAQPGEHSPARPRRCTASFLPGPSASSCERDVMPTPCALRGTPFRVLLTSRTVQPRTQVCHSLRAAARVHEEGQTRLERVKNEIVILPGPGSLSPSH